jgi:hypothetical protein
MEALAFLLIFEKRVGDRGRFAPVKPKIRGGLGGHFPLAN